MRETWPNAAELAETILFIKMIRYRYPYLKFRRSKLDTVCWKCTSEPVSGMPEDWMLYYLYQNQVCLKLCLDLEGEI